MEEGDVINEDEDDKLYNACFNFGLIYRVVGLYLMVQDKLHRYNW